MSRSHALSNPTVKRGSLLSACNWISFLVADKVTRYSMSGKFGFVPRKDGRSAGSMRAGETAGAGAPHYALTCAEVISFANRCSQQKGLVSLWYE